MNIFDTILLSEINAPQLTNFIGQFIKILFDAIGNYGVTVIVFTIILKLILSPLDIWQKMATRKQSKSMARLQPQMEKLQRQYANNPQMLQMKQAELYRKEKVTSSMLASCLPMIVTMVVFFVVFGGFNAMVKYQNEMIVYEIYTGYIENPSMTNEELLALYNQYAGEPYQFLWIRNIFMPDSWAHAVPTVEEYVNRGMGGVGASLPSIMNASDYTHIMAPAMAEYNTRWNGFMILPILSIVTTLLSTKFMQYTMPQQQTGTTEQQKQAQMSQKMMMIIMPIMIGIFSLFYSSAFSLYLFISNLISTIFNLVFNIIARKKDLAEQDKEMETTYI